MVYLDLLYVSLFMSKQHVKCGPAEDLSGCRISIKGKENGKTIMNASISYT